MSRQRVAVSGRAGEGPTIVTQICCTPNVTDGCPNEPLCRASHSSCCQCPPIHEEGALQCRQRPSGTACRSSGRHEARRSQRLTICTSDSGCSRDRWDPPLLLQRVEKRHVTHDGARAAPEGMRCPQMELLCSFKDKRSRHGFRVQG